MFGPGFSLDRVLSAIIEVKPHAVGLGSHHYVQLAESEILKLADPADLDSVKTILPAGAAVPSSCEDLIRKKFQKLTVILFDQFCFAELLDVLFLFNFHVKDRGIRPLIHTG